MIYAIDKYIINMYNYYIVNNVKKVGSSYEQICLC